LRLTSEGVWDSDVVDFAVNRLGVPLARISESTDHLRYKKKSFPSQEEFPFGVDGAKTNARGSGANRRQTDRDFAHEKACLLLNAVEVEDVVDAGGAEH